MRKIEIIEIENSFLNFFTPAVLVPASYFLFNLIGWPSLFLRYLIAQSGIDVDPNVVHLVISVVFLSFTCLILYYILIYLPRLKVHDAKYKKPTKSSLYTVGAFFCFIILINLIIVTIYKLIYGNFDFQLYTLFPIDLMIEDPLYFFAFIIYDIVLFCIFNEIVFRRALIPTLEDRGSSPFHAVLLAALGSSFIDLPAMFLKPKYPYDIYHFLTVILLGICAGLIYISTRNILFPILFSVLFSFYRSLDFFVHNDFQSFFGLINIVIALLGLLLTVYIIYGLIVVKQPPKLIKVIKIKSSSKILKGVLGYLAISLGLLTIQTIVVKTGRIIFDTDLYGPFPDYFVYILIFYAIAFSIPFFLTITTQWAKHPTN